MIEGSLSPGGGSPPWPRPDQKLWREVAGILREDPEQYCTLLHAINAPASLQCLKHVLRNVRPWLVVLADAGFLSSPRLHVWTETLARVEHRLHIEQILGTLRAPVAAMINRRSIINLCESHPVYAAFAVLARDTDSRAGLDRLIALAWGPIHSRYDEWTPEKRAEIFRSLRAMYDERGPRPALGTEGAISVWTAIEQLRKAQSYASENASNHLERVIELLEDEPPLESGNRSGGGGRGRAGAGGFVRGTTRLVNRLVYSEPQFDPQQPEDEESPFLRYRVEVRTRRGVDSELQTEPTGLAPEDLGESRVVAECPADPGLTLRQRLDRMRKRVLGKGIAADIAIRAQPLESRWELLTPAELGLFFVEVDALLGEPVDRSPAAKIDADAKKSLALLLISMLGRGLDRTRVQACFIGRRNVHVGCATQTDRLLLVGADPARAEWYWHLPGRVVAGGSVINSGLVLPTRDDLLVRVPTPFANLYRRVLGDWLDAGGPETFLIGNPRAIDTLVEEWCKKVNRRRGTRLSLARIAHYLPWQARCQEQLDPVMAAYIRGVADVNAATQAFYRALDPRRVCAAYNALWSSVVARIIAELDQAPPDWLAVDRSTDESEPIEGQATKGDVPRIGSKKVPALIAVQAIASNLVDNLHRAADTTRAPWARTIAYHNAYALYCLHFLLWGSGARSAHDPVPDLRFLHPQTGLLMISDKSRAGEYSTRLAWIGPDLVRQIDDYMKHLDALARRLLTYRPEIYERHRTTLTSWRGSAAPGQPKGGLLALFFELDDGDLLQLTPQLATEVRLPEHLRLPPNCNRHYLATYLWERRCPHDLIDAQLGHWQQGREPWGRSSTLAPKQFARAIGRCLEPMTREMGFLPRSSALVLTESEG
ncbi:hypothetical protein [Thiocapsa sp.]|uniref:hypothetical protein n=1 Tax=Thiocapsa sp. TaxID=2024551 RepID=UPI003594242B